MFSILFLMTLFFNGRMVARVPAVNNLERDVLNIAVEQTASQEDNQKNYSKREYSYSSSVRSFTLPESADDSQINASYTDGILRIDITKPEEAKNVRRQIEIK
jgi:HSP20 family protein